MIGFALFGATTYLPLFLQVVNGASPTNSGLRLLPLILLQELAPISQESLAKRFHMPAERLTPSIEVLLQKELVTTTSQVDSQARGQLQLTPAGQETVDKLATAY